VKEATKVTFQQKRRKQSDSLICQGSKANIW